MAGYQNIHQAAREGASLTQRRSGAPWVVRRNLQAITGRARADGMVWPEMVELLPCTMAARVITATAVRLVRLAAAGELNVELRQLALEVVAGGR
ncbi:MAG: hypothetical protein ACLR4Z_08495 [Butyricicoccaceae bacterium]